MQKARSMCRKSCILLAQNYGFNLDKLLFVWYNVLMKAKILAMGMKSKLIIAGAVVALTVGGVTAALNQPQTTGADTSPLTKEVDRQGEQLSNHEARLSNTENDVKDLQNKTSTPPSTNKVSVPSVSSTTQTVTSTPNSTPSAPAPEPVKVTQAGLSMNATGESHCSLTYSDGSQDVAPATFTTVVNGNQSSSLDNCQSYLGQVK